MLMLAFLILYIRPTIVVAVWPIIATTNHKLLSWPKTDHICGLLCSYSLSSVCGGGGLEGFVSGPLVRFRQARVDHLIGLPVNRQATDHFVYLIILVNSVKNSCAHKNDPSV